jgi:hypothetical protein
MSGWLHSQACLPRASGSATMCSRVSRVAAPRMHPHELQRAHRTDKIIRSRCHRGGFHFRVPFSEPHEQNLKSRA